MVWVAFAAAAAVLLLVPSALADPPGVSIVSGPSGPTASRIASFTFSIDVSPHKIAAVVCRLDDALVPCPVARSAQTGKPSENGRADLSSLAEGRHTFVVAVEVEHGKVPRPASRSWQVDVTPPVLTGVPADIQLPAPNGSSATVVYTPPTATDNLDPLPKVACSPASGSSLPVGTTSVACVATDAAGNSSSATFSVVVYAATTIAAGSSGTVRGGGSLRGVTLVVPVGAFPQGATVGFIPVENPDTSGVAGSEGPAFEIASTAQPVVPVELRVPYDESANGPAGGVTLGWWGDAGREWLPAQTSYDGSTGQLVATTRHFSTWDWFLGTVAGSTGAPPTCDEPLPGWVPRVFSTATDSLSLAYSCAGGDGGLLQVRVTSNRDGWVYATFDQKPTTIRYLDGPITFSGSSLPQGGIFGSPGDWRIYIPPNVIMEADFAQPDATPTTPVSTTIHGYASRDGVTYVGDALSYALSHLWSKATAGVLAPVFVQCAADFIDPATLTLLPTINYDTVFQCFTDGIENAIATGGFDAVSASDLASDLGVLKKASLWLQVGQIGLDLLDAHLDTKSKPAVIIALENTIATIPIVTPTLNVTPELGRPGASATAIGSGFLPGEPVTLTFDAATVATPTADSSGTFTEPFLVPPLAAEGEHSLSASGANSGRVATTSFVISVLPVGAVGTVRLVSRTTAGTAIPPTVGQAVFPMWRPRSSQLSFVGPPGLVVGDTSGKSHVYLEDRVTGTLSILDSAADGTPLASGLSDYLFENYFTWSPDGSKFAFVSNAGIYVKDIGSGLLTQIAPGAVDPVWSPDGSKLAYELFIDGGTQLVVKDLEGGTVTVITRAPDGSLAGGVNQSFIGWSSDGSELVFNSFATTSLTTDGVGGRLVYDFASASFTHSTELINGFSPDGTYVAVASSTGLSIRDVATGAETVVDPTADLSEDLSGSGHSVLWSPDGRYLAYDGFTASNGEVLRIFDTATGKTDTVADVIGGLPIDASWSPEGESIAFRTTDDPGLLPTLSPSAGSFTEVVAYSAADGSYALVSSAADGTAAGAAAAHTEWSPDGAEVAFVSSASNLVPAAFPPIGSAYGTQIFSKVIG